MTNLVRDMAEAMRRTFRAERKRNALAKNTLQVIAVHPGTPEVRTYLPITHGNRVVDQPDARASAELAMHLVLDVSETPESSIITVDSISGINIPLCVVVCADDTNNWVGKSKRTAELVAPLALECAHLSLNGTLVLSLVSLAFLDEDNTLQAWSCFDQSLRITDRKEGNKEQGNFHL